MSAFDMAGLILVGAFLCIGEIAIIVMVWKGIRHGKR